MKKQERERRCPACRYDWRGLPDEGLICPECGVDAAEAERRERVAGRIGCVLLLSPVFQVLSALVLGPWVNVHRPILGMAMIVLACLTPFVVVGWGGCYADKHDVPIRWFRYHLLYWPLIVVTLVLMQTLVYPSITRIP